MTEAQKYISDHLIAPMYFPAEENYSYTRIEAGDHSGRTELFNSVGKLNDLFSHAKESLRAMFLSPSRKAYIPRNTQEKEDPAFIWQDYITANDYYRIWNIQMPRSDDIDALTLRSLPLEPFNEQSRWQSVKAKLHVPLDWMPHVTLVQVGASPRTTQLTLRINGRIAPTNVTFKRDSTFLTQIEGSQVGGGVWYVTVHDLRSNKVRYHNQEISERFELDSVHSLGSLIVPVGVDQWVAQYEPSFGGLKFGRLQDLDDDNSIYIPPTIVTPVSGIITRAVNQVHSYVNGQSK